jgi:hypothetical protein
MWMHASPRPEVSSLFHGSFRQLLAPVAHKPYISVRNTLEAEVLESRGRRAGRVRVLTVRPSEAVHTLGGRALPEPPRRLAGQIVMTGRKSNLVGSCRAAARGNLRGHGPEEGHPNRRYPQDVDNSSSSCVLSRCRVSCLNVAFRQRAATVTERRSGLNGVSRPRVCLRTGGFGGNTSCEGGRTRRRVRSAHFSLLLRYRHRLDMSEGHL